METSQSLTIESFSYSWLINDCNKQELNTNSNVTSPKVLEETGNFCFDLPHASNLVDADEIFSNGRIVPKSVNQTKLYSCPATPLVHFPHKKPSKYTKKYSQLIVDWGVSSRKVFRKCFNFLLHTKGTKIVDSSRNSGSKYSNYKSTNEQRNMRIEVHETVIRRSKSWGHTSITGSHFSCSRDKPYYDYNESSVHEAIVHCKTSFEK